jgi:hypothetical protein
MVPCTIEDATRHQQHQVLARAGLNEDVYRKIQKQYTKQEDGELGTREVQDCILKMLD